MAKQILEKAELQKTTVLYLFHQNSELKVLTRTTRFQQSGLKISFSASVSRKTGWIKVFYLSPFLHTYKSFDYATVFLERSTLRPVKWLQTAITISRKSSIISKSKMIAIPRYRLRAPPRADTVESSWKEKTLNCSASFWRERERACGRKWFYQILWYVLHTLIWLMSGKWNTRAKRTTQTF